MTYEPYTLCDFVRRMLRTAGRVAGRLGHPA